MVVMCFRGLDPVGELEDVRIDAAQVLSAAPNAETHHTFKIVFTFDKMKMF